MLRNYSADWQTVLPYLVRSQGDIEKYFKVWIFSLKPKGYIQLPDSKMPCYKKMLLIFYLLKEDTMQC
jgi:hypothetical protein